MKLKFWHGLLLTGWLVLVVYYPALHAGYNSVDDLKMINTIENSGALDLKGLFFPATEGYYYRPLTLLSYFIDRDLWGFIPSFMHLENVLLHLGCALLVYAITRRLTRCYGLTDERIPFFAALLFALNPLTTESVCWISDRTDLLSAFFMLLSVWLLLSNLQNRRLVTAGFAVLTLLLACLAKEVAVFILPGMLWMVIVYPPKNVGLRIRLWRRRTALAISPAAVIGYFVFRYLAFAYDAGIKTALNGVTPSGFDLLNKLRLILKVYGFYFKKLLVPWPLNFGIVEVSDWYVLAGMVLLAVLIRMVLRADLSGALGVTAFCVLSPAILIPFGKMAWTPLAERYLYTSLALFAPMVSFFIFRWSTQLEPIMRRRISYASVSLLLILFISTLHRAWIWQDNLRLYADTVDKSPDFAPAKAELASALLRKGRAEESEAILTAMQRDDSTSDYLVDDLTLAQVLMNHGELDKARGILLPHLDAKSKKYYDLLQALLRINDFRIGKTETSSLRMTIQRESLFWLKEQKTLRPSAFLDYRIGKMQLAMGYESAALTSFRAALTIASADAYFRGAAETFIAKLERP